MPSLQQIVSYSRLFRLLRGRRPTAEEVRRYFEGGATAFASPRPRRWANVNRIAYRTPQPA